MRKERWKISKQKVSLSLSANPIHLIRGTFSVATEAFAGFNRNSNNLTLKITDRTKPMFSAPVILCPVHRILWQRVPNLVNKFVILLQRSMFTQDSRNKSENDGCRVRLLNTICKFFKFPSPARGEGRGLLRSARNDDEKRGESLESNIKIPVNYCIVRRSNRKYKVKQ